MLEEKKSPYNIYINPTESSHRQMIYDIVYNWRFDSQMMNDVYGKHNSFFDFDCPGYSYRLEFSSSSDKSKYIFEVKFDDPPHKMFEDLIAIPGYSFSVTFNEDGNIKEMYMQNVRPSNVPIYPKDPAWKLFKTTYELFDKSKEPEIKEDTDSHGPELTALKESRNFNFGDIGLIQYLIFHKFYFNHGNFSNGTQKIFHELRHNDGTIETKMTAETMTLDIIVYNYNHSDILGNLSIEFDSNGDIACYYVPCDNGDMSARPKIKDNITYETYEFIKDDKVAVQFFQAIYTIINNRVDSLSD